jgi:hypothetical protein
MIVEGTRRLKEEWEGKPATEKPDAAGLAESAGEAVREVVDEEASPKSVGKDAKTEQE